MQNPRPHKKGVPEKSEDFLGKGGTAERMSFRANFLFKARKRLSEARDDAVQIPPLRPLGKSYISRLSDFSFKVVIGRFLEF